MFVHANDMSVLVFFVFEKVFFLCEFDVLVCENDRFAFEENVSL